MSWTHLCELVKIHDSLERAFYEKQAVIERRKRNKDKAILKKKEEKSLIVNELETIGQQLGLPSKK